MGDDALVSRLIHLHRAVNAIAHRATPFATTPTL
jgi:hypothetical protein